jgi:D-3-phosphoglycerate dehydrogenase / 2-oxoglutarate reductase
MKILNAEASRYSLKTKELISSLGEVVELDADRSELLANLNGVDVLIICLKNTIDREVFELASSLKVIVTPTTGLNHIDLQVAEEYGVKILCLKGEVDFLSTISATAELTWGLLLCLVRRINLAHQHVLRNGWDRNSFYGNELRGKTLGIVGFGRLGKIVAEYGKVFGMKVLAHDNTDFTKTARVEHVSLSKLLSKSEVLSVHLPFEKVTTGYFDLNKFKKMKRKPIFLNTSRGEIVDEQALIYALENNLVKSAGLDVLATETSSDVDWLSNSIVWQYAQKHDNLLLSPHIGGVTFESVDKTNSFIIEKLAKYLQETNNF